MPETLDLCPEFCNFFPVRYLLGNTIFNMMEFLKISRGPHEIAMPVRKEELAVLRASEFSLVI